jgi:hypothetical protein
VKQTLLPFAVALVLAQTVVASAATTPPKAIQQLIASERKLNDKCRGGSGDDPATQKACDQRDALDRKLQSAGWCYGRPDQIEADKTWQPCPKQK